jgi:hypothetical protein
MKRKNRFPWKAVLHIQNSAIAVSFNEVNEEVDLLLFGEVLVTEDKDLGLDLVEGLFTEVADVDQGLVGECAYDIVDLEIAGSFQSVVGADGKLDIIDIGFASLFGKGDADGNLGADHFVDGVQKAVLLSGIVKFERDFIFSHSVHPPKL